jgi:hypothetical protein
VPLPLGKVGPANQICASGIFLRISQTRQLPTRDFIASHGISHIVLIVSDSEHTISHLSPLLPHKIYNMYISVGSY